LTVDAAAEADGTVDEDHVVDHDVLGEDLVPLEDPVGLYLDQRRGLPPGSFRGGT